MIVFYKDDFYDDAIIIRYFPEENEFYDECGHKICNIYTMLTVNDVILWRFDRHRHCTFPLRTDRSILCDIINEEEWSDSG